MYEDMYLITYYSCVCTYVTLHTCEYIRRNSFMQERGNNVEPGAHEHKAKSRRLILIVLSYSLCSSTLLLVNKFVLRAFPAPSTVLATQCFFTAFAVRVISFLFPSQPVEKISDEDLKLFFVVVACFVGTLFSNAKALQFTNVDTVIGLRLTMPLITSVLEYLFLGRELPNRKSSFALLGVAGSFSFYIIDNGSLSHQSLLWLGLWYFWTIFEGVFVKHVVTVSKLSILSKTYYLNMFSTLIMVLMASKIDSGRIQDAVAYDSVFAPLALLLSCFLGFGMSYLSFQLRELVSATTFNMVGNICKILTLLINSIVWNLHASAAGTASIVLCIGFTTMYSQAPMRVCQEGTSTAGDKDDRTT